MLMQQSGNAWGDAVKSVGRTGKEEIEFALYKNDDYVLLPVMLLTGKLDILIINTTIIHSVSDKEEN